MSVVYPGHGPRGPRGDPDLYRVLRRELDRYPLGRMVRLDIAYNLALCEQVVTVRMSLSASRTVVDEQTANVPLLKVLVMQLLSALAICPFALDVEEG